MSKIRIMHSHNNAVARGEVAPIHKYMLWLAYYSQSGSLIHVMPSRNAWDAARPVTATLLV